MRKTVYSSALVRAAEILGSTEALRAHLNVPMSGLRLWLSGYDRPPDEVFLRVVDLLAERDMSELRGEGSRTAEPG
jgi:hypothetical protein